MFSAPVRHQIDVRTVVPVGEKCLLPAVAALGYVMRIVGYNDSCDSGNGLDYRRSCRIGSRNKYGVPGITQPMTGHVSFSKESGRNNMTLGCNIYEGLLMIKRIVGLHGSFTDVEPQILWLLPHK